jgi:hypothetical protein
MFQIQVDVLMLILVFQDHYLDFEVSKKIKIFFIMGDRIVFRQNLRVRVDFSKMSI